MNCMDKLKSIEQIIPPPPIHWVGDGFRVHNFLPGNLDEYRMSPFYLLDYNSKTIFKPSVKPRGVDVHPHRGFETVTIAYKGKVEHYDSASNNGIIEEGDIQWMTAGSGILHKEFHEKEFSKVGGEFQMVQLWVNLPAEHKMTQPKYQPIRNKDFDKYILPNNGGEVEIIAGSFKNIKGKASTFSPIEMYNCRLSESIKFDVDLPENYNTALLVIKGKIKINEDKIVGEDNLCLFKNEGTKIIIESIENSIVLVISGQPLNEPIASYGPFLMNTNEEIKQAIEDYRNGKFGFLE